MSTTNFPTSRLQFPKHAETFQVCCRQTFGKPSPYVGASGCSLTMGKLAPLLRKFWCCSTQRRDYMQFIVPFILTTSFPKKLENSATEKTRAFYAFPTAPAHPTLPLLMSFIEQNTIHLQAMLKTKTGKFMTFKYTETT